MFYLLAFVAMRIVVVNNHTTHLHSIKQLFSPNDTLDYISYTQVWWYDFGWADCIVLTGSSNHPYYSSTFAKEIQILHYTMLPIIGICVGCELLVEAFGGVIHKQTERIQWDLQIYVAGNAKQYTVHEAHRYSVVWLSEHLEWVAKSDYGYEIIKHKTKPIVWFQFHPEVMSLSKDGYYLFQEYTKSLLEKPKIYIHHNDWFDDGNHYAFMSHRLNTQQ